MKKLLKNEISLFFTKKNKIIFIIFLIISLGIFKFHYIKEHENFLEEGLEEINSISEDIDMWAKKYEEGYKELYEIEPNSKYLVHMDTIAKALRDDFGSIQTLNFLWKVDNIDELIANTEKINRTMRKRDNLIKKVEEIPGMGEKYNIVSSKIYRKDRRDWENRMALWEVYTENNFEKPITEKIPTGGYILKDGLSGTSFLSSLFFLLVIFLNYDIWSSEFDKGTIRLLYTQPFSRKKLFISRYFIRLAMSIISIITILAVLFSIGTLFYGNGFNNFEIVNKNAISSFSTFDNSNNYLMNTDTIINIKGMIGIELILFISYIIFFTSIIHFLSYLTENGQSSLLISFLLMTGLILYAYLPVNKKAGFNPLLYFQTYEGIQGNLGSSIPVMITILLTLAIIINLISVFILVERENE